MAIGKISEDLKSAHDYLFEGTTVPANTTTNGTGVQVGGTQGALEITAVALTDIVITDTKTLTVAIEGSADNITFAALDTLNVTLAAGATTITAGTVLGKYIPNTGDPLYARGVLTTDDVGVVGTVDMYITYVAR